MNLLKITMAGVLAAGFSFPALAQDEEKSSKSNLTFAWTPVPEIKSANGNFVMKIRGRIYWDNSWMSDSDNTFDFSATQFRAARIGVTGQFSKKIAFNFEANFSQKRVTYTDISLTFKPGPFNIVVGHIKFAEPMENASSSRYVPFMERGGYNNAFAFGRQFAVAVVKPIGNGMIMAGVGKGGFKGGKGSTNNGLKLAARIMQAVPAGDSIIHLGGSIRYREIGDTQANYRYSTKPFQNLAPRLLNTTNISDSDLTIGLEAGFISGPFALYGELGFLKADLVSPLQGQSDPTFWGGHITATYFFTGEAAPYNKMNGTFSRPKVARPVWKGGPGAWQGAIRFDLVDLNDQGIFGGRQETVVIGVNWWLSNHIKAVVNYSHSKITQAFLVAQNGIDGFNKVNTFGTRVQIDW